MNEYLKIYAVILVWEPLKTFIVELLNPFRASHTHTHTHTHTHIYIYIYIYIYRVYTKEWCGCYPNWTPIMTITFYNWTVLPPPHFHRNVRALLNRVLQHRWIGRAAKGDNHLLPWPPRSPDLTPRDFFLWGFVKDSVYVPPLPMSLKELRDRITHALQTITADILQESGMNLISVWMCVVWPRVHTLKDCD